MSLITMSNVKRSLHCTRQICPCLDNANKYFVHRICFVQCGLKNYVCFTCICNSIDLNEYWYQLCASYALCSNHIAPGPECVWFNKLFIHKSIYAYGLHPTTSSEPSGQSKMSLQYLDIGIQIGTSLHLKWSDAHSMENTKHNKIKWCSNLYSPM